MVLTCPRAPAWGEQIAAACRRLGRRTLVVLAATTVAVAVAVAAAVTLSGLSPTSSRVIEPAAYSSPLRCLSSSTLCMKRGSAHHSLPSRSN